MPKSMSAAPQSAPVPDGAETPVSNRDIGFVYAGQEAEIKIDTFSFTRYGRLHGSYLLSPVLRCKQETLLER
jgi:hypothetical protein